MAMFVIFCTILVILAYSERSTSKVYDITTIYKLSDDNLLYEDTIDYDDNSCIKVNSVEIHARTNALPVTIFEENGKIITSSKTENFGISPAVGWTLEGWSVMTNDYITSEPSIMLVNNEKDDCQFAVSQSEKKYYNDKYSKIKPTAAIRKQTEKYSIYSSNEQSEISWVLNAPADQRIRVEYSDPDANKNNYTSEGLYESRVKIYDGSSKDFALLNSSSSENNETMKTAISTGHTVYVTYTNTGTDDVVNRPFEANYVLESQQQVSLTGDNGTLYSPLFVATSSKICIAILFQVRQWKDWVTLHMYMQSEDGYTTELGKATVTEENKWLYQRFEKEIPDILERRIRVIMSADKHPESQLFIRKVEECHADETENVIIVNKSMSLPAHFNGAEISEELKGRCINGGIKTADGFGCICPPGFTGPLCEDGCGKNKYGDDCGGRCSSFRKGCKGLIMCKGEIGCNCAPGFTGKLCQEECDFGTYGVGCSYKCEHCDGDETCDRYSGICKYGCKPGYFPPLCYYKYKHLSTSPLIIPKGTDSFEVIFSATYVQGRGTPKFYQLEYKKSEDNVWSIQEPYLLPNEETITTNLTNLDVFTEYNIRIVLIDSDWNSYDGDDIPYATERTECIVPEYINYDLQNSDVMENSLEVSWTYDEEKSWCPLEKFEIYLKDGWRWVLYAHTSESYINITDLNAGRTHKIKIRAVTKNGKAHFSKIYSFKTADEAPGPVGYLRQTSSKSSEIQITWDIPRYTSGNIRHYIVKYKCLKLVGCPTEDCSYSSGELPTSFRAYKIRGLLPFAQYLVSVSAVSATESPATFIHAATDHREADVSPDIQLPNVTERSDTTLTVQWSQSKNCTRINGYFYRYRYEIISEDSRENYMAGVYRVGQTTNTSVSLKNLKPDRRYAVKVYLVTSAGYNPKRPLIIHAKTRPVSEDNEDEINNGKSESQSYEVQNKETQTRKSKPSRCRCDPQGFPLESNNEQSDEIQTTTLLTTESDINDDWEYLTESSSVNFENNFETRKSASDYEDEDYYKNT